MTSISRREDIENKEVIVQELEDSIRVVLGNLDNLQPFATKHFIIFPYKSRWERVSHLKFKRGEIVLVPYPFVLTLYVEMKWFHENLSPEKRINNSPLELNVCPTCKVAFGNLKWRGHDALLNWATLEKEESQTSGSSLKVLAERKAEGAMRKKRKYKEVSSSPSRPGLDRAKMRTCSQGPSKKKLLTETRRSKERETHQECQETSACGVTDVQEQGSMWEDSPSEDIVPPVQQSTPAPPEGPTDPGTSGFFGFLSSLFPFRYFFRKSSP